MPSPNPHLAVVIPYYQRQPGLLRAAIASVLRPQGPFRITVLVIDDASPHPADAEIEPQLAKTGTVQLIRQPNAGPSAARNRGLDALPDDVDFVAFLDSDDQWSETFAPDARIAFDEGADLFFSDTRRFNESESRFHWAVDPVLRLSGKAHQGVAGSSAVFRFAGNFLDFAIRRTNAVSSAFAMRRTIAGSLRFDTRLTYGEDRLFKLELACRARIVAFSTSIGCIEGPGVNIFDVVSAGSGRALRLASDYVFMNRLALQKLPLSATQRAIINADLARCRQDWLHNCLRAARAGTPGLLANIAMTLRRDPLLPAAAARKALAALASHRGAPEQA